MRTFKFRAWDIQKKEMRKVQGFRINEDGSKTWNCCEQYDWWQPLITDNKNENCIIEQFTGLLDKNGKEIYEGDILADTRYSGHYMYVVRFGIETIMDNEAYQSNDVCGFYLEKLKDYDHDRPDAMFSHMDDIADKAIIGNVHENQELLK